MEYDSESDTVSVGETSTRTNNKLLQDTTFCQHVVEVEVSESKLQFSEAVVGGG